MRTSLVVQWVRICQMQGTQFQFLVQEDPIYHVAMKPLGHNH